MGATTPTPGPEQRPEGYIFDSSGLPEELQYLGDMNVSGNYQSFVIVGDPGRREFGRLPLRDVGTVSAFTIRAPLTAAAATASLEPQEVRIALRDAGGVSALVFFVKTSLGNSLSGFVTLGPTI